MNTAESRSTRSNLYARITNEIVSLIEAGAPKFEMPWHQRGFAGMPRNGATKKPYRGVNTLILWASRERQGFASADWASYLQWKTQGAQVRKDEKGTLIVFYKRQEERDNDGTDEQRPRCIIRHSFVFNADQVDGLNVEEPKADSSPKAIDEVDRFVDALKSDIRFGSDGAYYQPSTDRIFMPERADFYDTKSGGALEGFYSVLFHEHVHWTGHPSRLARDLTGKFGSSSYAMEELVAELGAAFLCGTLGISTFPRPDHASYIESWVKVLKEQKTAIFTAASAASAASQFLEGLAAQNMQQTPAEVFNPA